MLPTFLIPLVRRSVASILGIGPIPQHVAFIMDGNRRYAERHHLRTLHGHSYGYDALIKALEWCLELGITAVSVYAFSIDNYQRSQEEVSTLMQLAEEKLTHMLQEHPLLEKYGVQVRVIGDLALAPIAVQKAAQRIMNATQGYTKAVLNICFSYTYVSKGFKAFGLNKYEDLMIAP
jgi:ditrans,polycis-polyprenyl diphosphate synthase